MNGNNRAAVGVQKLIFISAKNFCSLTIIFIFVTKYQVVFTNIGLLMYLSDFFKIFIFVFKAIKKESELPQLSMFSQRTFSPYCELITFVLQR